MVDIDLDEHGKRLDLWASGGARIMREGWFTHREVSALVNEVRRLRAIETAARAMTTHYDECEECQDQGSCALAYDLWMAMKDALAASEEGE